MQDDASGQGDRGAEFMALVRSRRSIRRFTDQSVSDDSITQILEAGRLAPSRANCQPWRFVVITDHAVKNALHGAVYHQQMVLEAPVLITVLGIIDPRSSVPSRTFELVQAGCFSDAVKDLADHVLDHWDPAELKTDAALNAAVAATHMMLAAHALGLGCCWIKLCRDASVLSILGVPDGYYHAGTLAIGHTDTQPKARPRLPLSELVRYESFTRRDKP